MTRPTFLITLGVLMGAIFGMLNGGGALGRDLATMALIQFEPAYHLIQSAMHADRGPARTEAPEPQGIYSACLSRSGVGLEHTLRNLLEFHDHDATLALVNCLLDGPDTRFCSAQGRAQAADAMEIYLWSRDDARRGSPAHGMAAKIHLLDRPEDDGADLYASTWAGPADRAVFDRLKTLAREGYLDPGAFAFSGRTDLHDALKDVKAEASPCERATN